MTRRVLIIHDSLTVRIDLLAAFDEAGFEAEAVASLKEARKAISQEPTGLVVLDLDLPDGSGIRFLQELRSALLTAMIPAILLSSLHTVEDEIRGLVAGADATISKPYDRERLLLTASELLARGDSASGMPAHSALLLVVEGRGHQDLRPLLEAEGYQVICAPNGRAGLEAARRAWPQLIIIDGSLPDLLPPLLVQQLRLDPGLHRTPCLLFADHVGADAEIHALSVGADGFLRSKLDPSLLLARIRALLRFRPVFSREIRRHFAAPRRLLAVMPPSPKALELEEVLAGEGIELTRCHTPPQLIADPGQLSCILLDGALPDACAWIRAQKAGPAAGIPLLLLADDAEAALEAMRSGAEDWVRRDRGTLVIQARVRALLRRRQFEDESRRMGQELHLRDMEAARQKAARQLAESRAELTHERAARELAESRAAFLSELERKNAELTRSNQELSQFAYVASHDLKTPLQAIDLLASWLEEDLEPVMEDTSRKQLGLLRSRVARMRGLLDSLLHYSRAGRREERLEVVDLDELLGEVIELLGPPPGMKIERDGELPTLVTFRTPLFQVFTNLLANAMKHHDRDSGNIVVSAQEGDEAIEFAVSDDGPGIPPEFAERVFQMFQTLKPRDELETDGMGLALVQKIVHLQGGRVWLESRGGRGACFRFSWPKESQA